MKERSKERRIYELCLIITERCNLNCIYCHNNKAFNGEMSFATAKFRIDEMFQVKQKFEAYTISYMGGEPFFAFNTIQAIDRYIKKEYPDKSVYYKIVTNGTLVHGEIQEWIIQNRNNVQVILSMDGKPDIQNNNRSNCSAQIDVEFFTNRLSSPIVNSVITPESLSVMADNIVYLENQGFYVKSFLADGMNWSEKNLYTLSEQLQLLITHYQSEKKIKPTSILNMSIQYIETTPPLGCGLYPYNYTIDCNGDKFDCHRCSPFENQGTIKIPDEYRHDLSLAKYLNTSCNKCIIKDICNSCPASNASHIDNISSSEILCRMKKIIYKANAFLVIKLFSECPDHAKFINMDIQTKRETLSAAKKILTTLNINTAF